MEQNTENKQEHTKSWLDRYYKLLMLIPVTIMIFCLVYLGLFYSQHNDFILKDIGLSGGTSITLTVNSDFKLSFEELESQLKEKVDDVSLRKLADIKTGNPIAYIIDSAKSPEELRPLVEEVVGYSLDEENSSTEFSGSSLGANFYKQLIMALVISFMLMSIVIFIMFRTFIPSIAVIFAAFSDIVMPLALLDFLGVKISAAGIAAFLMLIGYSVDTDILLTTRAIKTREGRVNSRIYGAFKTGIFMTITALLAVIPAFFLVTGLPDSFRQIFLILGLGLAADIINTWMTNVGIIKWYCEKHNIT